MFIVADQAEQVLELGARRRGLGGRRFIRSRVTRGLRLQNGRRRDDFEVAAAQSRDQARPLVTEIVGLVSALLATLFSATDGRARMRRVCRVLGSQPRRHVRFDRDNEQSGAKGLSEGMRRRSAKPVTSSQERRRPQVNSWGGWSCRGRPWTREMTRPGAARTVEARGLNLRKTHFGMEEWPVRVCVAGGEWER